MQFMLEKFHDNIFIRLCVKECVHQSTVTDTSQQLIEKWAEPL